MDELRENIQSKSNLIRLGSNTLQDLPSNIKIPTYDEADLMLVSFTLVLGIFIERTYLGIYIDC